MDPLVRLVDEIEGYRELAMWQEADALFDAFPRDIHDRPHLLAFYIMMGAAVEVVSGRARKAAGGGPALTEAQRLTQELVEVL